MYRAIVFIILLNVAVGLVCEDGDEACELQAEIEELKNQIDLLNDKLSNLKNKTEEPPAIITERCISFIRARKYQAAATEYSKLSNRTVMSVIVPRVYASKIENGEKVIRFLTRLSKINETMNGYEVLFDLIKNNSDLDSLPMVIWRREISKVATPLLFADPGELDDRKGSKQQFQFRDTLNKTVDLVSWNSTFGVENFEIRSELGYSSSGKGSYILKMGEQNISTSWHFRRVGSTNHYQIKLPNHDQYLEATAGSGKSHLTLSPASTPSQNLWAVEPIHVLRNEYFKIQNVHTRGFLMAANDLASVLYPRKGSCDDNLCLWRLSKNN